MRKLLALVRLNLTHLRHDRGALLSMTLLPILLTTILGVMFGGGASDSAVPVAFVDADRSVYSKRVEALVKREKGFEVKVLGAAAAEKEVADNKVAAAVIVPKGFGASLEASGSASSLPVAQIQIIKGSDPQQLLAIQEVVRGVATRLSADRLAATAAQGAWADAARKVRFGDLVVPAPSTADLVAKADAKWDPPPVSVKLVAVKASHERGSSIIATGYNQYSLGMTLWFVLMLVLTNAESLLEERENGTLPRLLTTPTPRSQVLGGKVAGVYSIGIVQAAILITFSALAFKVDWGGDPFATALLIGTFTLAATGLAIMVAATARTRQQAGGLAPILAMSLSMLGGCIWPIEIVPPVMKLIALFTPTGWAMRGLTNVVVRNQGLPAAIVPSLVLVGFAAVFFLVGLTRFRWE